LNILFKNVQSPLFLFLEFFLEFFLEHFFLFLESIPLHFFLFLESFLLHFFLFLESILLHLFLCIEFFPFYLFLLFNFLLFRIQLSYYFKLLLCFQLIIFNLIFMVFNLKLCIGNTPVMVLNLLDISDIFYSVWIRLVHFLSSRKIFYVKRMPFDHEIWSTDVCIWVNSLFLWRWRRFLFLFSWPPIIHFQLIIICN
jgi:hypothetical protein